MLTFLGVIISSMGSLTFSTLTYSLREFSRTRLAEKLDAANRSNWLDPIADHRDELVLATAVWRLAFNILVLLFVIASLSPHSPLLQYLLAFIITAAICLLCSVALPHALAAYLGEAIIAAFAPPLVALRIVNYPLIQSMAALEDLVRRLAGKPIVPAAGEIEKDIVSVVEEGVKDGVVDQQEREMIESVIEFRDTQAGQIMTARPDILALEVTSTLDEVRTLIETSGHSRIPVYEQSLDHVVGILYARDLLKSLGQPLSQFSLRQSIRPAIYVPETKPLRDLLSEFRTQKVHIAIVLDEYGGTAGLVTIEDILEELVGEIRDEHEKEDHSLKKLPDGSWDADAALSIYEANEKMNLHVPTAAAYDTLGGYVSMTMGHIPIKGATFVGDGAKFTVLDASPQRIKRLRIESTQPQPQPTQTADLPHA